jgi:hypothetical protein
MSILVKLEDITNETAELDHILCFCLTGILDIKSIILEIRKAKVTKELTAVSVRISTDTSVSLGSDITKSLNKTSFLVEELFRMAA